MVSESNSDSKDKKASRVNKVTGDVKEHRPKQLSFFESDSVVVTPEKSKKRRCYAVSRCELMEHSKKFPSVFYKGWDLSSEGKRINGASLESRFRKLAIENEIEVDDAPRPNAQITVTAKITIYR